MEIVVVEQRFERSVTAGGVRKHLEHNAWCRELHGVRHLESFIAKDGRSMICVFEAPDLESVRAIARKMGYLFDRAYGAVRVGAGWTED